MVIQTSSQLTAPESASRQGMALVLVLGLVALLTIVVTFLLTNGILRLQEQSWQASRSQADQTGNDALQRTLGSLAEIVALDADLHSPLQGWDRIGQSVAAPWPDTVTVTLIDESGKLSLAAPDHAQLLQLFAALGLSLDQQQELADALLDWTDADDERRLHGAERSDYERLNPGGPLPPNRPLASLDELRFIHGFTPLFFSAEGHPTQRGLQLLESVTLHHQLPVNLNTANPIVLHALFPQQDFEIREFLRQRDGDERSLLSSHGRYWKDPAQLQAMLSGYSRRQHGVSAHTIRIVIEDARFEPAAIHQALLRRSGNAATAWSVQTLPSGQ